MRAFVFFIMMFTFITSIHVQATRFSRKQTFPKRRLHWSQPMEKAFEETVKALKEVGKKPTGRVVKEHLEEHHPDLFPPEKYTRIQYATHIGTHRRNKRTIREKSFSPTTTKNSESYTCGSVFSAEYMQSLTLPPLTQPDAFSTTK